MTQVTPYLRSIIKLLKFVTPFIGPWVDMVDSVYKEEIESQLDFMAELVNAIPELKTRQKVDMLSISRDPERISGAPLRALRELLDKEDPLQQWGGLARILTPEGHYLWVCEYHSRLYK